ncbi:hypothetical protein Bca4012_058428 [Brassica carinata]
MGRAVYAKLITSVEDLKRAIIESYGLVGMSVVVEMSYWLGEQGSGSIGEREAPVQISNDKDFELFTSACKVDKYINVFVTFKEEIDGKMNFLRPMGNLLKSKEVASSRDMQVGSTSADVHTRNEVNDVDGTACEVQNKVDTTKDAALEEAKDDDDEDYDYNLWHDFVGQNCEWDDDKDEDGGVGGGARTNVTYGGVRVEVATKARSGRTNPSSNKGSGSSTNKQRTANPLSTFEDYVDEGRYYIGSSRCSMENTEEESNNSGVKSSDQVPDTKNHSDPNQEEDPSVDSSSQILVLVTPPKPFIMHTREVDDSDDFVGQVPQCVSSRPTHDTSDGQDEEDDFEEPVPKCVSVGQTHETPDGEDEDDDFVERSRSREEDARRRREKDKADDESLMKSIRAVELYGFEDVEPSSNNEAVNDYTVDDIDFTLADADMYAGKLFSNKLQAGPRASELSEMLRTEFLFTATYWKCWKAKELATVAAQGTEESSYKLLPKYFYVLKYANPGSITDIKTEKDDKGKTRFKYAFMVLKACIDGWKHLRKVLVVDCTHMFGKYKGCLLTASGQDANFQVFPIAFAVVDNETNESWSWFFEKLTQIVEDDSNLSIVSDRAPQICVAKDQWYPLSHHGCCLVHLQRNVDAKFKKRNQKQMVGRAAEIFKVSHFKRLYTEIKLTDKRCWDYLEKIDPRHWTRSHFEGERYNPMSSNIDESLNKALVPAIMALFEFIRRMISRWFVSRQRKISKMSGEIPPAVDEWMENNLEDPTGFGSSVNLETRSCTCLEFQKVGIPCRHAIVAAMFRDLQHSEFVADAYLKKTWNETTKGVTLPVPDPQDLFIPSEVSDLIMLPPKTKRPPGRPPTKRKRSAGEIPNDGLHIRHDCLAALEEEVDCLRSQYAEEVSPRRELQFELAQMREEIKELKQLIMGGQFRPFLLKCVDAGNINAIYYEDSSNESDDSEKRPKKKPRTEMQPEDEQSSEEPYGYKDTSKMKQGDSSVREYNTSFAATGLFDNPDQGMLVEMYRDGLKEDIRVALGSTEFSTIDDIMQATLDIEEGPRSSSSDFSNESDESEKRQKKKPRTEMEPEDEQPDEDPYGDKDETDDGEGSTPNTRNESESESDSAVDLKDYQEYLQNNHLSCSKSSEESD